MVLRFFVRLLIETYYLEPPAPEPMPAGENYRSQEIDSQIGEVPVSFQNPVLVEVLDRQHAACA
jgi:hypothetical protein